MDFFMLALMALAFLYLLSLYVHLYIKRRGGDVGKVILLVVLPITSFAVVYLIAAYVAFVISVNDLLSFIALAVGFFVGGFVFYKIYSRLGSKINEKAIIK